MIGSEHLLLASSNLPFQCLPAMSNQTTVVTSMPDFSITINGVRIQLRYNKDGAIIADLTNDQVRELGVTATPASRYILVNGIYIQQMRGGDFSHRLDDLSMLTGSPADAMKVTTAYVTPLPPLPPKKQKPRPYTPRPSQPRTTQPARRGPAWKFKELYAACDELIAENPNDPITIRIAAGLARARQVAGQD
jgi:hypothetical protein